MYRDHTEQFHVLSPQEHLIMHHKAKRIHIVVKLQHLIKMPHQPLPARLPWTVPLEAVFLLVKLLEVKWWLLIQKLEWWDLLISNQAILLHRNQIWTKRWTLKVDLGKARIYFGINHTATQCSYSIVVSALIIHIMYIIYFF